jgi:hypothetical protein
MVTAFQICRRTCSRKITKMHKELKLNGSHQLLDCDDEMNIIGCNRYIL